MRIEIRIENREPPSGEVALHGDDERLATAPATFVGWLGLIRALADALQSGR